MEFNEIIVLDNIFSSVLHNRKIDTNIGRYVGNGSTATVIHQTQKDFLLGARNYFTKAIYFLTRALKQSIFGLRIPKPHVKWLFAWYNLIFVKKYLAGLNTLRTLAELGKPKLDKK